jgi:ribosome maturation factor RimP
LDALDAPHAGLEARLVAIVTPTLEGMGYELVRVAVLGRDRLTVQIM